MAPPGLITAPPRATTRRRNRVGRALSPLKATSDWDESISVHTGPFTVYTEMYTVRETNTTN